MRIAFHLFLFLSLANNYLFATTYHVNNLQEENSSAKQFKDLAKAIKVAQDKDTIFLTPNSNLNEETNLYSSLGEPLYLSKSIVFIGPGFFSKKSNFKVAKLASLMLGASSSGSKFLGLVIDRISFISTQTLFDYKFDGCFIKEIDFTGIEKAKLGDMIISRSYITGKIQFAKLGLQITGLVFRNNIFYQASMENSGKNPRQVYFLNNNFINCIPFVKVEGAVVSNNFFYKSDLKGCSNSIFNNNLTFNCKNGGLIPYGSNDGKNNFCDLNPQIEKLEEFTGSTLDQICSFNWSMGPNSPGIKAGTDFTDIGITGGFFQVYEDNPDFIFSGEPINKK